MTRHAQPLFSAARPLPHLWIAVLISILVHIAVLGAVRYDLPQEIAQPMTVTVVLPSELKRPQQAAPQKQQLVSPSQAPEQKPPDNTNQRSERDSATEREQIKRGLPERPSPPPARQQQPVKPAPKAVPEKRPEQKASPRVSNTAPGETPRLRLSDTELARTLGASNASKAPGSAAAKSEREEDSVRLSKLHDYRPFRGPSLGQLLRGNIGTGDADFLLNIQDGDITLLNAKADRFAVFVRRVSYQVFSELRRRNWQQLPAPEVQQVRGFVTVIATMNRSGELAGVEIADGSGSSPFDRAVEEAARAGTWDRNPPANASGSDGNIRFVFKARTWGQFGGSSQRRWLLLAAGLL